MGGQLGGWGHRQHLWDMGGGQRLRGSCENRNEVAVVIGADMPFVVRCGHSGTVYGLQLHAAACSAGKLWQWQDKVAHVHAHPQNRAHGESGSPGFITHKQGMPPHPTCGPRTTRERTPCAQAAEPHQHMQSHVDDCTLPAVVAAFAAARVTSRISSAAV